MTVCAFTKAISESDKMRINELKTLKRPGRFDIFPPQDERDKRYI
jgi:hypothetical protein